MVTKARNAATHAAPSRPLNGVNHHHPSYTGTHDVASQDVATAADAAPQPKQVEMTPPSSDAAPDMQAPKQGQANPQEPPRPSGEAPADEDPLKQQQEEELLAKANSIRALRASLDLAAKGPGAEPEQPVSQWGFLLKEMRWLAVDFFQERLWKKAAAKKLAVEAAAFDRKSRLRQAPGEIGEEIRSLCKAATAKEDSSRRSRKASKERQDVGQSVREDSEPQHVGAFLCYQAFEQLGEVVLQQLTKAAEQAAIAQELKIRAYELQYEKSLQEARELAILARRQIAAELRGRENTPAGDFDDEVRNKKRKRPRSSTFDDLMNGDLPLAPSKRPSNLRKQQLSHSRPDSGLSEEARNAESDAVNSMPGSRRGTRRKKIRDYDDDDYEDTFRPRDSIRVRRPPANQNAPRTLRSSDTKNKKKALGNARQGSRMLDPEALLAWSQLDDNLLCSIVHEFGSNWRLVADIFAMSCTLSGIHRSAAQCLQRFRELAAPHTPEGQEIQQQAALDALRINKTSARDLISKTLPLPEAIIQAHQKILLEIGKEYRDKRLKSYQDDRESGSVQQEPHETMLLVQAEAQRANGGRILTPLQVVENNEAQQKAALAAQHLANQQMQAAQQSAQQQAQAAAAAAAPVGPGMSGGPAVSGGNAGGGYAGADSPSPGASQSNGSPMQLQPPMAQQNGPMGMGKPSPGLPNGQPYAMPPAQTMPPPTSLGQQPPPRSIHAQAQQLQHILTTGKMPRGEDLTPEMRQNVMNKLREYQRIQSQANANRGGGQMIAGNQRQMAAGGMRPMGINQSMQVRNPAQMAMQNPGLPPQHPMRSPTPNQGLAQSGMSQQGMAQQGVPQGAMPSQMGVQQPGVQAPVQGQMAYNQSPQQAQGQRPVYPNQVQEMNPSQGLGQYPSQMQSPHLGQQQGYGGQSLAMHSSGQFPSQMQSPQLQSPQGHSPAMLSPGSQIPGQPLQQTPQPVQGHYGVQGQLMNPPHGVANHLQQRQGMGQLPGQMQGQFSSPIQNGPTNQMHPGVQGQQAGSWNPRMHAGGGHGNVPTALQPGMTYHPQAGMTPAMAQGQGRPHLLRPQQPGFSQHSQPQQ